MAKIMVGEKDPHFNNSLIFIIIDLLLYIYLVMFVVAKQINGIILNRMVETQKRIIYQYNRIHYYFCFEFCKLIYLFKLFVGLGIEKENFWFYTLIFKFYVRKGL